MSGVPIVTFSSIDWDYVWQGHQEVMSRLAAAGHPILFVENTGLRRPRLADAPRLWRRARQLAAATTAGAARQPAPGIDIHAPRILPFPYSPSALAVNRWLLERPIRKWIAEHRAGGQMPLIVWTYLPTPLVCSLAERLSPSLRVYYCVDDLPASSDLARQVATSEAGLFQTADLVFVTTDRLRQKALGHRTTAHLFPPGVSYERFEAARKNSAPRPGDIRDLPRPIVGYVGGLHRWFDVELAASVARRLPDVQFVFIGPVQVPVEPLTSLPNVHLLGARPHDAVPAYLRGFDAAIIPYVLDEYTRSVFPTKLNEYLAMGLPVVSTPMAEVVAFRDRHGPVVEIAASPEAFQRAVARALEERPSATALEARHAVAKRQGWDVRVAEMQALLEETLSEKLGRRAP